MRGLLIILALAGFVMALPDAFFGAIGAWVAIAGLVGIIALFVKLVRSCL